MELISRMDESSLQYDDDGIAIEREEEGVVGVVGEREGDEDDEENAQRPLTQTSLTSRCHFIDFFRGLAIITMLQANIIPYINHIQPILALRLLYSLAAPTFIFLSGYSATKFSSSNRNRQITSFPFSFQRVIFSAIFVDVVAWATYPLQTFDVLYIISIIILTLHHFNQMDIFWILFSFSFIFLVWLAIFFLIPYRFHISILYISQSIPVPSYIVSCIRRLFFDGWFPFFPWILVGWFGSFHVRLSKYHTIYVRIVLGIVSAFLTYLYLVPSSSPLYTPSSKPNELREDYEEIFYPVTPLYFFWCCSTVSTLLSIFEFFEPYIERTQKYNPFCLLGRNSLLVYILHCLYISYIIIVSNFPDYTLQQNWFNYLILYLFVTLLSYIKEYYITDVRRLPTLLRLITGI